MEEKLKLYIQHESLFSKDDTILLAVSGGMDSVSLFELFRRIEQPFAVAHCNFKLRNDDSDADESFVRTLAEQHHIPFHCKTFDTHAYVRNKGVSIQMAARELRYNWFEELLQRHRYAFLATAHHRDDSIETLFINLFRGTGIRGLRGILPKQGSIVHPLLFASRKDINHFITQNNIPFREDKTNATIKYERNKIRHELLPLLQGYSKNLDEVMLHNLKLFRDTELVVENSVAELKKKILTEDNNTIHLELKPLLETNPTKFYLFEILHPYGFNESTIDDVFEACKGISGKQFFSATHRLIKDRDCLIISRIAEANSASHLGGGFFIEKTSSHIEYPVKMQFEILPNTPDFIFEKQKNAAYFDYEKLKYPLLLRRWQQGDYFFPYGMKGKKMLSNLFSDLKLSLLAKENFLVLCSENDIVWAVGQRSDNRYKVGANTKQILKITLATSQS